MRIRQNARRLVAEGTPLNTSFILCNVNQSPWDNDAFFSQLFEDEFDDRFPFTRSSTDPSHISNSNQIVESPMELVFEYIGKPLSPTPPQSTERRQEEKMQPIEALMRANSTPPIPYINLGSTLRRACDQPSNEDNHMFIQPRAKRASYRNIKYLCPPPTKKPSSRPPLPPSVSYSSKKRGHPKKHAYATRATSLAMTGAAKNNKSSDFYYYTKFGPSWGKKRGEVQLNDNDDRRTSRKGKAKKQIINEDDIVTHMNKKDNKDVSLVDYVDDVQEIIYIMDDDDDDDDDDNGDGLIRKKPWKRIKITSLKSLM